MPSWARGTGVPSLIGSPILENVTYWKPSGSARISSPFWSGTRASGP